MPNPEETPTDPGNMSEVQWKRTQYAADLRRELQCQQQSQRFFDEPDAESKYGYLANWKIIGHDTEINGGVYIGGGQREAVVVDDERTALIIKAFMRS